MAKLTMSEILKMVEEDAEKYPNDPETCEHKNKREKMYCTLCEDCGIVVNERSRNMFYAVQDEDGRLKVILPKE